MKGLGGVQGGGERVMMGEASSLHAREEPLLLGNLSTIQACLSADSSSCSVQSAVRNVYRKVDILRSRVQKWELKILETCLCIIDHISFNNERHLIYH